MSAASVLVLTGGTLAVYALLCALLIRLTEPLRESLFRDAEAVTALPGMSQDNIEGIWQGVEIAADQFSILLLNVMLPLLLLVVLFVPKKSVDRLAEKGRKAHNLERVEPSAPEVMRSAAYLKLWKKLILCYMVANPFLGMILVIEFLLFLPLLLIFGRGPKTISGILASVAGTLGAIDRGRAQNWRA